MCNGRACCDRFRAFGSPRAVADAFGRELASSPGSTAGTKTATSLLSSDA